MTTCPRSGETYIEESLASLKANGFREPLIYDDTEKKGDLWGFVNVCKLMLEKHPDSKRVLIMQDDAIPTIPESSMWLFIQKNIPLISLVSLFTMNPEINKWTLIQYGHFRSMRISTERERAHSCNGGIAYLVSRQMMKRVVSEPWGKWTPGTHMLGELCHRTGKTYCITNNNYFEHIGRETSLDHSKKNGLPYLWNVSAAKPFRINKGDK